MLSWLHDTRVFFKTDTFGCPSLRCQRSISLVIKFLLLVLSASLDSATLVTTLVPTNWLLPALKLKHIIDIVLLMQLIDSSLEDEDNSAAYVTLLPLKWVGMHSSSYSLSLATPFTRIFPWLLSLMKQTYLWNSTSISLSWSNLEALIRFLAISCTRRIWFSLMC